MTTRRQASFAAVSALAVVGILGIALNARSSGDNSTLLETPKTPPQQVFVQLTNAYPDLGNVLILAQLTSDQVDLKEREGKGDFISLGEDQEILLRDDGLPPDELADDGLYTAIAYIDPTSLLTRSQEDESVLGQEGPKDLPVFGGRTIRRFRKQQAFDYSAFSAGKRVPLEMPVVELEPEDSKPAPTSSEGFSLATAGSIPPPPPMTLPNPTPSPGFTNLFQERVLVIRNPAIVQDPTRTYDPCTNSGAPAGVWTFNHLMTQMANQNASGIDPALFVEQWLQTWTANQTVNTFNVPPRNQMQQILNQWPRIGGRLDLNRSPLRLLAIMPRVDLRRTTGGGGYSGASSGNFIDSGELRFIFGFILPPGWDQTGFNGVVSVDGGVGNASCRAIPFTVIFEYEVPACGCEDVRDWACEWVQLRNLDPLNQAYRQHLTKLTQRIVRANADPNKPNGSALRTLRTNEVALVAPWELREFQLTQTRFSMINETTADDTPHDSFFNTAFLFNWLTTEIQPNLTPGQGFENAVPPVKLFFSNVNFLGANPRVPVPPPVLPTVAPFTYFWTTPGLAGLSANGGMNSQNWARHRISRAACSGCHRRETNTQFVHVDNANAGFPVPPVPISGFLSGINNVADPAEAAGLPARHFDDLLRREIDIKQACRSRCFKLHPINKEHVLDSLEKTGKLPSDLFAGMPRVPVAKRPSMSPHDLQNQAVPSEVH